MLASSVGEKGLVTYSTHPASHPRAWSSSWALAVRRITGVSEVSGRSRSIRRTDRPSRAGSITSRTIRSGWSRIASSMPRSPSGASRTSWPANPRLTRHRSRMSGSSSITRTRMVPSSTRFSAREDQFFIVRAGHHRFGVGEFHRTSPRRRVDTAKPRTYIGRGTRRDPVGVGRAQDLPEARIRDAGHDRARAPPRGRRPGPRAGDRHGTAGPPAIPRAAAGGAAQGGPGGELPRGGRWVPHRQGSRPDQGGRHRRRDRGPAVSHVLPGALGPHLFPRLEVRPPGVLGRRGPSHPESVRGDHRCRPNRPPPADGAHATGVLLRRAAQPTLGPSRLSLRSLPRARRLGGLPQDPHDLGAAHRAVALRRPAPVLEGHLGALELALGPALHAVRLVLGHSWPPSGRSIWADRSRLACEAARIGGLAGTMLPLPRHGCKYLPGMDQGRRIRPVPNTIRVPTGLEEGEEDMTEVQQHIAALLSEERVFEPPPDFVAKALVKDRSIYEEAEADYQGFWAEQAERLTWFRTWDSVMEWTPPWVKWFSGGTLNACYNCLDRHVETGGGGKVAYHWEGEPGEQRTLTYKELLDEVCRFANALKALGVARGDRVAIYLGMVPELPVAMLACARIGAPHSVVF